MSVLSLAAFLAGCSVNAAVEGMDDQATVQSSPADFVKLYYAKSLGYYNDKNLMFGRVKGFVEIADVAYQKEVYVRYIVSGTATWIDVPAYFVKNLYGKQVWQFDIDGIPYDGLNFDIQFCVWYKVNGQTYWDNNNGQNYRLLMQSGDTLYTDAVFGKSQIALSHATAYIYNNGNYDSVFTGMFFVRNMGNPKNINVVYSTDGWATSFSSPAIYLFNRDNQEEDWRFYAIVPSATTRVEFALSYAVNGYTTWDNNFLDNYIINIPAGEVRGDDLW